MALSGLVSVPVTDYNNLVFSWTAVQDAVLGRSSVEWALILEAGDYGRIDATPGSPWEVTVDGQFFSGRTSIAIGNNQSKTLATGTALLEHGEDGQKTFAFAFSQEFYITFAGETIRVVSGEGTGVLDPLDPDAAPLLSHERIFLGETVTITPQGPAGAVYKITYILASASGLLGDGLTGPVQWQVPEALGEQFPWAEEATVRILCDAYVDGKHRGRTREAALTVAVPDSAVPTVAAVEWVDVSPAGELGVLVQGISQLNLDIQGTGILGSRVESCRFQLDGRSDGRILSAGQVPLTVTVTDSRGRTGEKTEFLEVLPYSKPQVFLSAHRCREDGTADDTGAWVLVRLVPMWTGLPGNRAGLTLTVGSKVLTLDPEGEQTLLEPAPAEQTVFLEAVLSDRLASGEARMTVSTAYCTLDLLYGGRGIAFGAVATEPGFHCAMDVKFSGRILLPDGTDLMERLNGPDR